MKIYLAGPMTHYKDHGYNVEEFQRVRKALESQGHSVTTPFDISDLICRKVFGYSFDPWNTDIEFDDPILREMIAHDIAIMLRQDAVAFLDDTFTNSLIGCFEFLLAQLLGMPLMNEEGGELKAPETSKILATISSLYNSKAFPHSVYEKQEALNV